MKVKANGIEIELEDTGGEGRPVVLLIMGLNMQLIAWPDNFVKGLVAAGFRVVRFDNRDAGLSTQFDDAGTRNLLWQGLRYRFGLPVQSAYGLQDMANDAIGVLDALGIRRAHVLGASMGGMIAQRVAATVPERVTSLVSLMSSSGARGLPGPRSDVVALMMRRPVKRDEASLVAHSMRLVRLIAGPFYPPDEAVLRERPADHRIAGLGIGCNPVGTARQHLGCPGETPGAQIGTVCHAQHHRPIVGGIAGHHHQFVRSCSEAHRGKVVAHARRRLLLKLGRQGAVDRPQAAQGGHGQGAGEGALARLQKAEAVGRCGFVEAAATRQGRVDEGKRGFPGGQAVIEFLSHRFAVPCDGRKRKCLG